MAVGIVVVGRIAPVRAVLCGAGLIAALWRAELAPLFAAPSVFFPALMLASAYYGVLAMIAMLSWFMALFTGRMPGGMRDLGAAALRYGAQAQAYTWLLTDRYPYSAPFLRREERPEQLTLDITPGPLLGPSGEPA
jgi:hypothetical protein